MLGIRAITVGSTNTLRKHSKIKSYVVGYTSAFILTEDGVLYGSGSAHLGQLGNGTAAIKGFIPIASDVVEVKTSQYQTCYLNKSKQLYGFGNNGHGWFGLGDVLIRTTPTLIAEDVKFFEVGTYNIWYIDSANDLYAAGYNSAAYGCLGIGSATTRYQTFIKVASNAAKASADAYNSAYLSTSGVLYYAGRNQYGEAGKGTTTPYTTWIQVTTGVTDQAFVLDGTNLYGVGKGPFGLGNLTATYSTWTLVARDVRDVSVGIHGVVYVDLRGRTFATGADGSKLGFVDDSAVPYWKELVRPLTSGTYTLSVDGMKLVDNSGESLTIDAAEAMAAEIRK